jgi:HAD superfamily hydrolase (TIGR01509 family)
MELDGTHACRFAYGLRMSTYDLVIFDLDGTLVPTEALAEQVMGSFVREMLALDLSDEDMRTRYRGRDFPTCLADLEGLYGMPIPSAFLTSLKARWTEVVENDLAPSVGVVDALEHLTSVGKCVASNSALDDIELSLRSTGLDRYFDRYFSGLDVESPKPAPDVYLLAADEMGVPTDRCVVVEDTVLGITAATNAGMHVIGCAVNDPDSEPELKALDVSVITSFAQLPALVL